jgi:large subunit ribosomal protein L6
MSRIGNLPVKLPSGVTAELKGTEMSVKGPKGLLSRPMPTHVTFEVDAETVRVSRVNDSKPARERHGLARSLIQNMVTGVSEGFIRELEIVGVGYRARVSGGTLNMSLGYSHPIEFPIPSGIDIKVQRTEITVSGIDKEVVGQTAALIRGFRKPDAYKGKGVRYKGERIRLKAGKSGATGA